MFQFPSNGKVYPKVMAHSTVMKMLGSFNSLQTGKCIQRSYIVTVIAHFNQVSIPFKRESVSKAVFAASVEERYAGFNSLQTGKCIQSRIANLNFPINSISFNFPSNGKVYPKAGSSLKN